MKHPADNDDVGRCSVDKEMSRLSDDAIGIARSLSTAAQMPTAHFFTELGPSNAARSQRILGNVAQCSPDQPTVPVSRC
jgi:hypothetical protein